MTDAPKIPPQHQDRMPADENDMRPEPDCVPRHPGVGKLKDRVAFISGDDGLHRTTNGGPDLQSRATAV